VNSPTGLEMPPTDLFQLWLRSRSCRVKLSIVNVLRRPSELRRRPSKAVDFSLAARFLAQSLKSTEVQTFLPGDHGTQDRQRTEAELMAKDSTVPDNEILALATLLKEALCIEHDLTGRLSKRPAKKSLLKLHEEYQQVVEQLTWELERALARYLTRSKAAAERAAMRRSGRASVALRPTGRGAAAR